MFVVIEPLDTLFTRDSRSFGVNQAHAVDSIFPPPPSVMFGAFRTALLTAGQYQMCTWGGGLTGGSARPAWFGNGSDPGQLRQRGPLILRNSQPLFPLPLDALLFEPNKMKLLKVEKTPEGFSSINMPYCFRERVRKKNPKATTDAMIDAQMLTAYLNADKTGANVHIPGVKSDERHWFRSIADSDDDKEALWANERRTNVGIHPHTYAGVEGKLFSLTHVRMNARARVKLLSEWDGPEGAVNLLDPPAGAEKPRLINLGGEKRPAMVQKADRVKWPQPATSDEIGPCRFRLYFATPAFFKGGWAPFTGGDNCCELQPDTGPSFKAKLLAAAVGKYFSIGGYDIEKHQERAIRRFVPPGTVYHFESERPFQDVVKALNGTNIGDDSLLRAQGYGLAFVGKGLQH